MHVQGPGGCSHKEMSPLSARRLREALRCCRRAVELEGSHPEMWLALSRVAERAGRRGEAYSALSQGLTRHPGHRGIQRELRRMGLRRSPVIGVLPRSHAINVLLGLGLSALRRSPIVGGA